VISTSWCCTEPGSWPRSACARAAPQHLGSDRAHRTNSRAHPGWAQRGGADGRGAAHAGAGASVVRRARADRGSASGSTFRTDKLVTVHHPIALEQGESLHRAVRQLPAGARCFRARAGGFRSRSGEVLAAEGEIVLNAGRESRACCVNRGRPSDPGRQPLSFLGDEPRARFRPRPRQESTSTFPPAPRSARARGDKTVQLVRFAGGRSKVMRPAHRSPHYADLLRPTTGDRVRLETRRLSRGRWSGPHLLRRRVQFGAAGAARRPGTEGRRHRRTALPRGNVRCFPGPAEVESERALSPKKDSGCDLVGRSPRFTTASATLSGPAVQARFVRRFGGRIVAGPAAERRWPAGRKRAVQRDGEDRLPAAMGW